MQWLPNSIDFILNPFVNSSQISLFQVFHLFPVRTVTGKTSINPLESRVIKDLNIKHIMLIDLHWISV